MAYSATTTAFAQSVNLAVNGRYVDDISDDDGQQYIAQVVDFLGGYLDELETVTDNQGQPVYWNFAKTLDYDFGASVLGNSVIALDPSILYVVTTQVRKIYIVKAGQVVSYWDVVSPNQLNADPYANTVCKVGGSLYFNRTFTSNENGGEIFGDVVTSIERPSESSDVAITTVIPRQLLVMGVAKNLSLPDIVQGGLSPTFLQRYNDILQSAILFNNATAVSDFVARDDYTYIGGVGF